MILSHLHKFVFIKGKKVAGTSVEMALARLCGPGDIITPITPIDERARLPFGARNYSDDPEAERRYLSAIASTDTPPGSIKERLGKMRYHNHMPAAAVERKFGDLGEFEIVFVERNPYAKVISWANMSGGGYSQYSAGGVVRSSPSEIRKRVDQALASGTLIDVRNIDRYRLRGRLSAGWRYETLREQLMGWARDKGEIELPHAKPGLSSNELDIRAWLTAAQIRSINELFHEEFTTFGYEFAEA